MNVCVLLGCKPSNYLQCLDDVINFFFCFFMDEIAGAGRSAGAGLQVPDIGEKCAEDSRER